MRPSRSLAVELLRAFAIGAAAGIVLVSALAMGMRDAHASEPQNTAQPLDCSTGICTSRLVRETVPADSTRFRWTTLTQQFNRAAEGENVASYSQQWKEAISPSWALVAESRCIFPRGGCHGAEIDLVVDGPVQDGDWRLGQSIVIWKMPNSTSNTPEANNALLIAGGPPNAEEIRVVSGVNVEIHCKVACLRVRSGEKIALDDAGQIAIRYDQAAQSIEFLNGARVVFAIPVN